MHITTAQLYRPDKKKPGSHHPHKHTRSLPVKEKAIANIKYNQ